MSRDISERSPSSRATSAPEPSVLEPSVHEVSVPDVSVIVHGPWTAARIAQLAEQSLEQSRYEVVDLAAGDDYVASGALGRAVAVARGRYVLFLGPDERPHPELLTTHLAAHTSNETSIIVQGRSVAVARGKRLPVAPLTELARLAGTPHLPLDARAMCPGEHYGFRACSMSNVSIDRHTLIATGGLDVAQFADGIGALADVVYRLEGSVVYRDDAISDVGVAFDIDAWLEDRRCEGIALARLAEKHDDPTILWFGNAARDSLTALEGLLLARCEFALPLLSRAAEAVWRHGIDAIGTMPELVEHLDTLGLLAVFRGVLVERTGRDPIDVVRDGPTPGRLTSIIMLSHDALAMTQRSVERLRRFADHRHPQEIIVVDNGSADGSRQWLEEQTDIEAIVNATNVGAPVARNQALGRARGDYIVFMDNDAMVTEGWLGRLLYHAEVDGRVGFVGPVTDRASHGQALAEASSVDDIDAFAATRSETHHRFMQPSMLLSSFCILASRELLERIGGFDPRFSPWGFEDDDITLRAHVLGYRNRIALDVFVQHLPYGGPKLARHDDLLQRMWSRFAYKWGLPATAAYGQGREQLDGLRERKLTPTDVFIPWDASAPAEGFAFRRVVARSDDRPQPRDQASCESAPLVATVDAEPGLELSIVVPSYDRPDLMVNLLARLDAQTIDPEKFEVIIVDDGSPTPLAIDESQHRYRIELLRQDNAGPGAARNLALTRCRAPLTLIFNDDAVPAPDNLEHHLNAHRERPGRHAVLGTFDFVERVRNEVFTQVIDNTSLLFDYVSMRAGEVHGWWYFWTCNLSMATDALRSIGGFDSERFREAIVEDVELGYRLAAHGYGVLYWPTARCGHDHALGAASYFRRMVRLGVNLARMYRKHGDPGVLWRRTGFELDDEFLLTLQLRTERELGTYGERLAQFLELESQRRGQRLSAEELAPLRRITRELGVACTHAGILLEERGSDLWSATLGARPADPMTVVVMDADQPDAHGCLDALHHHSDPSTPFELLLISSAESAAELRRTEPMANVLEVESTNRGVRRQRALDAATQDAVLFLEPTARVGRDWLRAIRHHLDVDALVAMVAPGPAAEILETERAANDRVRGRYQRMLHTGSIAVRRTHVAELGGFDPVLGAVGLEVEDLSLRVHLAGRRNRLALDVATLDPPSSRDIDSSAWAALLKRWGLGAVPVGDWRAVVAHLESRSLDASALQPSATESSMPTAARRSRLGVCMIARDEEDNIGRALDSVRAIADEMVVVDTGSVDATRERARAGGARVVDYAWTDDFAAARNVALETMTTDWILSLDADEELLDADALRRLVAAMADPATAYLLPIRNLQDREGREEVFISHAPRLFARDASIRWHGIIHEQLTRVGAPLHFQRVDSPRLLHRGYLNEVREARGKEERNLTLLRRAVERTPDDARLHFCIGQTHYEAGRHEQALAELEQSIALSDGDDSSRGYRPHAVALAVGACFSLGRYEKGAALGDGWTDARMADLEVNVGGCQMALGHLTEAREHYARARAMVGAQNDSGGDTSSSTWRALQGLGNVAALEGDGVSALRHYEEALVYAPQHPTLLLRAAETALELGDIERARKLYRRGLAITPGSEDANIGAAVCRAASGDLDGAVAAVSDQLEKAPHSILYRAALADLLMSGGAFDGALEILAPTLQIQPPSDALYTRLGKVMAELGRMDESRDAFAIAVAANPRNAEARAGLKSLFTVA